MASKITYEDKEALYENPDIEDINKVNADDMNEIKRVVNENADLILGEEVAVSTTEPTGDETIWINPDDAPSGVGSYISNEYGTSQEIGYSQEYVNNAIDTLKEKTIGESTLVGKTTTIPKDSWEDITQTRNVTLEKGIYLFIVGINSYSNYPGPTTFRVMINDNEYGKETSYLSNGIGIATNIVFFYPQSNDGQIAIKAQGYGSNIYGIGDTNYISWFKLN